MITSALELVRAKVREVEALEAEIATLTRKRESIIGELAQVRAELGVGVQLAPAPRATVAGPHRELPPASEIDAPLSDRLTTDIAQVTAALSERATPINFTELEGAVAMGGARLGYVLDVMRRRGLVESVGIRRGMRYRLPVTASTGPTEAPKARIPLPGPDENLEVSWSGASKRSVMTGDPLDNPPPRPALASRGHEVI